MLSIQHGENIFSMNFAGNPIVTALFFLFIIIVYFMPTLMAKRDRSGMFLFNLMTGWSGIGWMACAIVCMWVRAQIIVKEMNAPLPTTLTRTTPVEVVPFIG